MSLHVISNFDILDEGEDWIVVDKPAPLIVHPANNKPEPTLLGGLEHLCAYEIENGARLGIINRLDRETSGIVLVAKNAPTAREFGMAFQNREVFKEYLALVAGWPPADSWETDAPILRENEVRPSKIWVKQVVHQSGRPCYTRFSVEKRFETADGKFALVKCFPRTGRMHQIRVHLAHSGHPIVGDKIYSGNGGIYLEWMRNGLDDRMRSQLRMPRQALHASSLSVPWRNDKKLWHSELPADFQTFLRGGQVGFLPEIATWTRPS